MNLRNTIKANKAEMFNLFESANLQEIILSSQYMPYLMLDNTPEYFRASIESLEILGKLHPISRAGDNASRHLYRLSVPLSAERMKLLREKFRFCRK